jgi:hypothetical protein
VTLGVRVTIPVSWPATLGTTAGTGDLVLTSVYRLEVGASGSVTGENSPCGARLPAFTFSALIGGGNCRIEIPDGVWDLPDFPSFEAAGTLAGWQPGSAFETVPIAELTGLTMAEPDGAWPTSYTAIQATDADDDGNPGLTAIPATGAGFAAPPASIIGPNIDQVHIVTRNSTALSGTFTSCTELQGSATLGFFDNHAVGCRTIDGAVCNAIQTDFVDSNRTIYETSPGSFTARILPDDASCDDARAALP